MKNQKIFVIGGCRSGKSRYALDLAQQIFTRSQAGYLKREKSNPIPLQEKQRERIFIATCQPLDEEMKDRVSCHQKERGKDWITVESPIRLPQTIIEQSTSDNIVLADCLTLWISNLLMKTQDKKTLEQYIHSLKNALNTAKGTVIIVSNEVGTGIVPDNSLARLFRDLVGLANQTAAASCGQVIWMVAGIPVTIKTS